MRMSTVAEKMSVREFLRLCSIVDQVRPEAKFTVIRIDRRATAIEVKLIYEDNVIQDVSMGPGTKATEEAA